MTGPAGQLDADPSPETVETVLELQHQLDIADDCHPPTAPTPEPTPPDATPPPRPDAAPSPAPTP